MEIKMHATFDKLLEPIRNKSLSRGQRHFYAIREITLTNQTNAELKKIGDTEGQKFGEEYLRVLKELLVSEGLNVG